MSKYLEFKLIWKLDRTNVYAVLSKSSGRQLGIIKWFIQWRQYCFFPDMDTVFNRGCLQDINDFLLGLKLLHKLRLADKICGGESWKTKKKT